MPKFFQREPKKMLPEEKLLPEHASSATHSEDDYHEDYFDDYPYPEGSIRTLLSWSAPARPFRKKDRSYYTTIAILIILVSIVAILAGDRLIIGVLLAMGFVAYVLNFVPPEDVSNKISTQGITVGDHFYHWNNLDSFWIEEKDGHKVLSVLTLLRFPGMLMLLLDGVDQEEVKDICARYLPFHEIAPKTMVQKWTEGLQKHFPLENPHK